MGYFYLIMNLKTYHYIRECLEMGHRVKVKYHDGSWHTFYDIDLINTFQLISSKSFDALMSSTEIMLLNFSDEYEIIPRIPKLLQPGDKCVIIDTEETRGLLDSNLDYGFGVFGKTIQIDYVDAVGSYHILLDNGCIREIPYFMVAPVPPEENKLADVDTEEMVKELESRGLLVDGKILK